MKESKFIEKTILRLRRQYSKDELVAVLVKQLEEKDIKLGESQSEVHHLEHELKDYRKQLNRQAKIEARKDALYLIQEQNNKRLRQEIKELRKTNGDLIIQIVKLKQKQNL